MKFQLKRFAASTFVAALSFFGAAQAQSALPGSPRLYKVELDAAGPGKVCAAGSTFFRARADMPGDTDTCLKPIDSESNFQPGHSITYKMAAPVEPRALLDDLYGAGVAVLLDVMMSTDTKKTVIRYSVASRSSAP